MRAKCGHGTTHEDRCPHCELAEVMSEVQRYQPGGSPPPGDCAMLTSWVIGTIDEERGTLREQVKALEEAVAAHEGEYAASIKGNLELMEKVQALESKLAQTESQLRESDAIIKSGEVPADKLAEVTRERDKYSAYESEATEAAMRMEDERDNALASCAVLGEALKFYGDTRNWKESSPQGLDREGTIPVDDDGGSWARAALASLPEEAGKIMAAVEAAKAVEFQMEANSDLTWEIPSQAGINLKNSFVTLTPTPAAPKASPAVATQRTGISDDNDGNAVEASPEVEQKCDHDFGNMIGGRCVECQKSAIDLTLESHSPPANVDPVKQEVRVWKCGHAMCIWLWDGKHMWMTGKYGIWGDAASLVSNMLVEEELHGPAKDKVVAEFRNATAKGGG